MLWSLAIITMLAEAAPYGHACPPGHNSTAMPFCNPNLAIADRVQDLLGTKKQFSVLDVWWWFHKTQASAKTLPTRDSRMLDRCTDVVQSVTTSPPTTHCIAGRLSVEEKAHLIAIRGDSADAGVLRLGIPPYSWGVEILHGAGIACIGPHCPTIFPVLACAASAFNRTAWHGIGSVISTEMRASNNAGR